jgi:2-isopropylmalate synthase
MFEIVQSVKERSGVRLGIHCQDDTGCAIANSVSAVEAGATHVQCTANGYGERTGNADLFVVVPNLQLKLGIDCLPEGALAETVRISHAIAEIANIAPNTHQPYAGWASFAHKAGLHASALKVNADLYNHIDPAVVGNVQNVLVTEMAGRASIELKGAELGHDLSTQPELVSRVVEQVKELEAQGWTFEAADASFELLLLDGQGVEVAFEVESWRTIVEQDVNGDVRTEATVKVHIDGDRIISTAEGNGPVNALDRAMRRAIVQKYPDLESMRLVDYKVRILDEKSGTGAKTRVLIGTSDGVDSWSTVGVHENVIAASWRALEDAVKYGLLKRTQ